MTQHAFNNALRILLNLDGPDLGFLTAAQFNDFMDNPHRFFIRASDETADRLWRLVQQRQPARYREVG